MKQVIIALGQLGFVGLVLPQLVDFCGREVPSQPFINHSVQSRVIINLFSIRGTLLLSIELQPSILQTGASVPLLHKFIIAFKIFRVTVCLEAKFVHDLVALFTTPHLTFQPDSLTTHSGVGIHHVYQLASVFGRDGDLQTQRTLVVLPFHLLPKVVEPPPGDGGFRLLLGRRFAFLRGNFFGSSLTLG